MPQKSARLFDQLRTHAGAAWQDFVAHPFVLGLADGSLPQASFRHYLSQDYLFLIHFARAYALAAYKADNLADIRAASAGLNAIVHTEMALHVKYSAAWGLTEAEMAAVPEASATMAYTRYVLEKGLQGDLLDLYTALAPCIVGYAEIARTIREGATAANPYAEWIETYAADDYQALAQDHITTLDRLWQSRAGGGRFDALATTFSQATRLEVDFWHMGYALTG